MQVASYRELRDWLNTELLTWIFAIQWQGFESGTYYLQAMLAWISPDLAGRPVARPSPFRQNQMKSATYEFCVNAQAS